jgi:hypothetical protein
MMKKNTFGLSKMAIGIACSCFMFEALAYDDWQMERLFNPSAEEMARESNGGIFIYDGLTDKIAAKAMDEHFDRIQAMMFVRTVVTNDAAEPERDETSGEVIIEDDGCD